jgi:hypothetical protein
MVAAVTTELLREAGRAARVVEQLQRCHRPDPASWQPRPCGFYRRVPPR